MNEVQNGTPKTPKAVLRRTLLNSSSFSSVTMMVKNPKKFFEALLLLKEFDETCLLAPLKLTEYYSLSCVFLTRQYECPGEFGESRNLLQFAKE